ncbi:hypothetical protein [Streptomyces sp. NPDC056296]|uniref:hypothetical protein n=1 Tax=Streptomyces sp. NPDC056296 TaxID=3345775 RepID=UPI0035E0873C
MTAPSLVIATEDAAGRWSWPIVPDRYYTAFAVRPAEARAVREHGVRNLRRLQYQTRPHWAGA